MNTQNREYIADVVGDIVLLDPENNVGALAWSLGISDFLDSEMPQKSTLKFVRTALILGVDAAGDSKVSFPRMAELMMRVSIGQQKFEDEFPDD